MRSQINYDLARGGIYYIKNIITHKVYVGSAISFKVRKRSHFKELRGNYHHCSHLQNSFNKYNEEDFEFEVIKYVDIKKQLIPEEQRYMDWYGAGNHDLCYNTEIKAGGNFRHKFTKKQKQKMKDIMQKYAKTVIQYDLNGKYIKAWPSITCAAKNMNLSKHSISNCCRGKSKSSAKSQWSFEEDFENKINKKMKSKPSPKGKAIFQYNINGEFIKEWNSAAEVERELGFDSSAIRKCCKGKLKIIGNCQWKEVGSNKKIIKGIKRHKTVPVVQCDLDNNFIKKWDSITLAAQETNWSKSYVWSCCQKNKIMNSEFRWMYEEEFNKQIGAK